ncbi:MAG TPA: histidine--tRNA ligase [Terriglobales bacterium]|nr:histidine--tRNA ligase [Terriglobales bacterium]
MPTTPPIKAARGVRDILPAERAAFAVVEHAAREQARGYGYQDVELPIIEPVELIERGVGGDTDVARKELYRLEPHGDPGDPPREIRTRPPRFRGDPGDGDRDSASRLVLRPEATASMVRAYFQGGLNQGPQPVRLSTIGPFFRHDKPQHLRYRQFVQFDVEVIGDDSPAYDAEVIELTWGWLERMGIRHVSLELNSIGDENCRPQYLRALQDYYRPLKDQLDPDCRRRVEENPLRLFDCKEPQCQPLMAAAPRITDHLCGPCAAAFEEVKSLLGAAGLEYRLNPRLVRGLDYYTRTVFEYQHEALGGAQNSLGGGGRYDGLAAALGYPGTPGVGFAGGVDRVAYMLQHEAGTITPPAVAEVLVLPVGDGLDRAASQVGRLVRAVRSTAVDYSSRSLRAKMRAADRTGARWAVIMNADEAERRIVVLHDMVSGDDRHVAWERLAEAVSPSPSAGEGRGGGE